MRAKHVLDICTVNYLTEKDFDFLHTLLFYELQCVLVQNDKQQQRVLYCNGKLFLSTHFMVFLIMHDLFQRVLHSPFNCGWVMETSSKRLSLQKSYNVH